MHDSTQYARSLGFSDEALDQAMKRINNPDSPNELLAALIDLKSQDTSNSLTSNPTVDNTSQLLPSMSNVSINKESPFSSCYSSITSFQQTSSSSSQSLDSVQSSQVLLRNIYVDGSNVAKTHGLDLIFSWPGIKICVDWFATRGHKVKVFVPEDKCFPKNDPVICYLIESNALIKTPEGCNDDNFIIEAARLNNGIIVSNDQYRDEKRLKYDLQNFIYNNRLPYIFVEDMFIPALDPLGRSGPTLDEFLQHMPPGTIHKRLSLGKSNQRHRHLQSTTSLPVNSIMTNRSNHLGLRDPQFANMNTGIKHRNTVSYKPSLDSNLSNCNRQNQIGKSFSVVGYPSHSSHIREQTTEQPKTSFRHRQAVYIPKSHNIQ